MARTINGIGTKHFGKANYEVDDENQDEEFDTTLWVVFLLLPVIPLKSYRIRQKQWFMEKNLNYTGYSIGLEHSISIVKDYSLNLRQVFKTYFAVYGGIIVFFICLHFLSDLVK
jgi:predicted ferric reductase